MGIRNYRDCARVYFDMDGVLMDYVQMAINLGISVAHLKSIPGIYETLSPLEGATRAVDLCLEAGFDVFALTKAPAENPSAASDKIRSIYRHFPQIGERVIITPDKGCVGTSRDFLIDDHPQWANASNFPGTLIHFKGDWEQVVAEIMKKGIKK